MPRKDEPDTASTGNQSPKPTKESSPSPELLCGARESVNRESLADPSVQKAEFSEWELESGFIAESVEDVSGSVESDSLSVDSICSRCGGLKRSKNAGLKPLPPVQFTCRCHPKKDEVEDDENTPMEEIPLADVTVTEMSQLEVRSTDQNPVLSRESPPDDGRNSPPREVLRRNRPFDAFDVVNCLADCLHIDSADARWKVVAVIIFGIAIMLFLFIYLIMLKIFSYLIGDISDTDDKFRNPADYD